MQLFEKYHANLSVRSTDVDTDGIDADSTATTVEEVVEFFVKEEQTVIE